jgi:hypothetical protein
MIRLGPEYLDTEGTATEWFAEQHIPDALPQRLAAQLHNYCIEEQANTTGGRMVLEAIIFSALLSNNYRLHKELDIVIKGGVSSRDPHALSIVQVEIADRINGQKLASMSLTYSESSEDWDWFDLMEVA